MSDWTLENLRAVEDQAPKNDLGELGEARFARQALGAQHTGLVYHVLRPGRRQAFAHRHDQAEEVAVVLSGSGLLNLDGEVIAIEAMDAIRIAPQVTRAFEAGPDGLEFLVFGPHHARDGEIVRDFWPT
ncbi:MAG: hypothetical protein NVSMB51_19530 [Solirubrobacteraceae bacterium]